MKKMIVVLLVLAGMTCSVTADDNLVIVCTTTTLEILVEHVGGDCVEVISLVQPGVCPSHFDVRPSHVDEVGQADLIVYHGIEPWLEGLIEASDNQDVERLETSGPWNTPVLAVGKIEVIRDALIRIDPENTGYYNENAEKVIAELDELGEEIKQKAETLQVDTIPVVCMEWQTFPVEWLGFTIVGTYSPPETLSMKDINDLITTGKDKEAVLVIDNLQSGTEVGSQIAAAIGGHHVVLTNYPNAIPGTETIATMIEYNANQLFDAVTKYKEEKVRISELESELQEAHVKGQVFEMLAVILFVLCVVEAVVIYIRRR